MRVCRISRAVFPVLDGEGARRVGGRWNSQGVAVVYTASSRALALLESLAALEVEDVPADLALHEIEVPEGLSIETLSNDLLPADWQRPLHPRCREVGDDWARSGRSLLLAVPSALVPEELNYLQSPAS